MIQVIGRGDRMPDLTIENRWVCRDYREWRMYGSQGAEPECKWSEEYNSDGLEVVERDGEHYCPGCGGAAMVIRVAV